MARQRGLIGKDLQGPIRPDMRHVASSGTLRGATYRYYLLLMMMLMMTVSYADKNIFAVVLEPIKREFGLSDTQAGLLAGLAFSAGYGISSIPLSMLADRWGQRYVLAPCLILWSGMMAVCGYAHSYGQLLVGRLGVGVGEGSAGPTATAIVCEVFAVKRRVLIVSLL